MINCVFILTSDRPIPILPCSRVKVAPPLERLEKYISDKLQMFLFVFSISDLLITKFHYRKHFIKHKYYVFSRAPRRVRIAVIQNKIQVPTDQPLSAQRNAILDRIEIFTAAAALCGTNVICYQEAFRTYFIHGTNATSL